MKLKNKKTGEIIEFDAILPVKDVAGDSVAHLEYDSLADLNAEWEDAPEEPKEYYAIDLHGDIIRWARHSWDEKTTNKIKEIGNYFETKEEAEKAVEKLKAWKRLKDKGFRFVDHLDRDSGQGMTRYEWDGYINGKDLDLLFCPEENS